MTKNFKQYLNLVEGYKILPAIDKDRYPEIDGLEGPFRTLSGKVVYYDPKEGKYYDKDSDMYLSYDEFREIDTDYSGMRDERDEVKEDKNSDNMIYIADPFDDNIDPDYMYEVYINGNMVTSGGDFELDGKSFDSVDGFVRALSKKFNVPVDSFDLYALDDDDENSELIQKNFIPRDGIGEGNEFSGALAKARASGADEFEVDGKKYPVKEESMKYYATEEDGRWTDGTYTEGDSITYNGMGWNLEWEAKKPLNDDGTITSGTWYAINNDGEEVEFEPGMEDRHDPINEDIEYLKKLAGI